MIHYHVAGTLSNQPTNKQTAALPVHSLEGIVRTFLPSAAPSAPVSDVTPSGGSSSSSGSNSSSANITVPDFAENMIMNINVIIEITCIAEVVIVLPLHILIIIVVIITIVVVIIIVFTISFLFLLLLLVIIVYIIAIIRSSIISVQNNNVQNNMDHVGLKVLGARRGQDGLVPYCRCYSSSFVCWLRNLAPTF